MGTAMVQLNTRIDPMLKAGGDAVLTRNGSRRKCWCKGDALAPV